MGVYYCAICEGKVSGDLNACPHCGHPMGGVATEVVAERSTEEKTLFTEKPAMFRDKPTLFILFVLVIPFTLGLTLVVLVIWWFKCATTKMIVTNRTVTIKGGFIAKNTTEVRHVDIRNIQVKQNVEQRIFGVGKIYLSSAAQSDIEIKISGIRRPQQVAKELRELQG